jgi:hypothetical protein
VPINEQDGRPTASLVPDVGMVGHYFIVIILLLKQVAVTDKHFKN